MTDVKQKFVIVDGEIITGRVKFHRQLHKKPIGGGWWYWHQETDTLYLYGTSFDFGSVTKEDVDNAVPLQPAFENSRIVFVANGWVTLVDILERDFGRDEAVRLYNENDFV